MTTTSGEGRGVSSPFARSHNDTAVADGARNPSLADGVELIGEYAGSGYKKPPQIAKRSDGQIVQLSKLLYLVAQHADGTRTVEQIADEVGAEYGKAVSPDNVRYIVDEKLRGLGILELADGSQPRVERVNPFLALKFKTGLVPDRVVAALTKLLVWLYFPPIQFAAVGAFLAFDVWLFGSHGIGSGLRLILYKPALMLLIFGVLVLATAFHELGHATACRYGGAEPGRIGIGLYIVWPAFYTDVTDSYRLSRGGRLRVDLGGLYFNSVFILIEAGLYFYTGFEPLLLAILVQQFEMLHQFLPFVRLDGYFVVSDLVGVPDLFQRMGPILKSMLPGKEPDASVRELRPRVRFAVSAWVLIVVPILALNLGLIVVHLPRILGTAWDSLGKQAHLLSLGFSKGAYGTAAFAVFQMIVLAIPMLGIIYLLVKLSTKLGAAAWRHSSGRPALRAVYSASGAALLALIAFIWLPNGDYKPIRPGEKWTLQSGLESFRYVGTGRPGLTPADPKARTDPFAANPNDVAPSSSRPQTTSPTSTPAPAGGGSTSATPSPDVTATPTPTDSTVTPAPTAPAPPPA